MNDKISIYDHSSGEIFVKELTNEEQAQRDAESQAWIEAQNQLEVEIAAKKAAAEAKLVALGLDLEDFRALGL